MHYRREIDGLRAVAVLPVILYHARLPVFSGGFVGVDVFFVISGYLITTLLIGELDRGDFSLPRFYERRARRILPALFLVMVVCYPFAWFWMFTDQFRHFSESAGVVVLGLSNFYFLGLGDYFGPDVDLQPLIHTWSLAVEEQYYFVFPLMLFGLWKLGRRRAGLVVALCVLASLLFADWASRAHPAQNFYFTFSRLWEIGAGSIVAFVLVARPQRSNDLLGVAGLGLILYAVFAFDESTPFPGVYALLPVVGTALIIVFAGQDSRMGRVLSFPPLVGIGLVSYSAYLWHQPLFAFARTRSIADPSRGMMALLILVSFGLAWATWRWVELPFRRPGRGLLPDRRAVFLVSGAVSAIFVAVGSAVSLGDGLAWRLPPDVQRVASVVEERISFDCAIDGNAALPPLPPEHCLHPATPGGPIQVALLGDSHALAIAQVLGQAVHDAGLGYYDVSFPTCVPFSGLHYIGRYSEIACPEFNTAIRDSLLHSEIETVVITARFAWYLEGTSFDNSDGGVEGGAPIIVDRADQAASRPEDPGRRERVLGAFETQIRDLAQHVNVVLVYPIPEAGWNVPQTVAKRLMFSDGGASLTTSYNAYLQRTRDVNALFDRLVAELPDIYAARVHEAMCDAETGRCVNADSDQVYYRDDDHLSTAGARRIVPVIMRAIEDSLTDEPSGP